LSTNTQGTPPTATRMVPGQFGKESNKSVCPVCNQEVDYLLGVDTPDGGVMGCERCWKQPQAPQKYYQEANEDLFPIK